jgi:hypothetical protein
VEAATAEEAKALLDSGEGHRRLTQAKATAARWVRFVVSSAARSFISGLLLVRALNGAGTPILCDTGSGLDLVGGQFETRVLDGSVGVTRWYDVRRKPCAALSQQ